MIQRVQTIFLFLVGVCMLMVLFFPLWEKVSIEDQQVVTLTALSLTLHTIDTTSQDSTPIIVSEMPTYYIAILSVLAALVAFYSIFQYNSRLTQMKLGALNSLLMAAVLGVSLFIVTSYGNEMLRPEIEGTYKLGFFLPAFALIFNVLSNRFIRRDEKLVRSVDRIR